MERGSHLCIARRPARWPHVSHYLDHLRQGQARKQNSGSISCIYYQPLPWDLWKRPHLRISLIEMGCWQLAGLSYQLTDSLLHKSFKCVPLLNYSWLYTIDIGGHCLIVENKNMKSLNAKGLLRLTEKLLIKLWQRSCPYDIFRLKWWPKGSEIQLNDHDPSLLSWPKCPLLRCTL